MARYEIPPDPRESNDKRPRRMRRDYREPTPWRYLGMGVVVTFVSLVIALALANALLRRPPLEVESGAPTLIILTAPPSPIPSPTTVLPTPSPIPTFTPIPTPDQAIAPPEVTVDYYAVVANTEGVGARLRGGPSTDNAQITIVDEGELLLVIGGPAPDEPNNRVWWQVERADGTQGWVVGEYLLPAAAPGP
ncbi:MAG TPA: SH3 domain-containing protein [Chloroflexota bacterium]|nr:SH3 domain-containing protein [Chloroflexota bacterium]